MVNRALLFMVLIVMLFLAKEVKDVKAVVNYQFHIPANEITLRMNDMTWEKLPPLLKESISRNSAATKLSKKDLQDLSEMYRELAETQTEPISLKGLDYGRK